MSQISRFSVVIGSQTDLLELERCTGILEMSKRLQYQETDTRRTEAEHFTELPFYSAMENLLDARESPKESKPGSPHTGLDGVSVSSSHHRNL